MLKLKLQYFGNLMRRTLIWKDPDAGKDWGQEEKGTTEDKMVGWHHWLNGHGFGWTPGVGDGLGGLECCGSWDCKELDTTEWLNWTELNTAPVSRFPWRVWPALNVNIIVILPTGQGIEVYGSYRHPYSRSQNRQKRQAVNCRKAVAPEVNQWDHAKQALCKMWKWNGKFVSVEKKR